MGMQFSAISQSQTSSSLSRARKKLLKFDEILKLRSTKAFPKVSIAKDYTSAYVRNCLEEHLRQRAMSWRRAEQQPEQPHARVWAGSFVFVEEITGPDFSIIRSLERSVFRETTWQ